MRIGQMWRGCLVVCLGVNAGCTAVNGGAVELSWKLRPASGSTDIFVDCDQIPNTNPVTRIRLDWQVDTRTGSETWNCTDYHGVTGFDLPVGTALLAVSPECESGAATTSTYIAPAPEQRMVIVGNTISLGAVELIVEDTRCDQQPCICH
jgi:hypothetical protein